MAPIASAEDTSSDIVQSTSGPPVVIPADRKRKIYDNNEIIKNGGNDSMDVDDEIFDGKVFSFNMFYFYTDFSYCRRFEENEGEWTGKRFASNDKRIEKSKSSTSKDPRL